MALSVSANDRTSTDGVIQPLKVRIVQEVGYGLSVEGASAAALAKSMQAAH